VSTHYQDTSIDYRTASSLSSDPALIRNYLSGDEPHYLIEVKSIVDHRTLDLRQTYQELNWPHNGSWQVIQWCSNCIALPWHDIGLPLLLLVPYVLAGTFGVLVFMCGVTAIVGAEVFRLSYSIHGHARYALISTIIFGIVFLLPFSSQIYPDMLAALITIVAVRKIFVEPQLRTKGLALTGALIGFSILLNPKFIVLFIVPLVYVAFMLLIRRKGRTVAAFVVPFLFFLLVYCYYTWHYFGSIFFTPYTAAYSLAHFSVSSSGVFGLLIDREHGVFAYFPALYLMFFGLVASMKKLGRKVVWVIIMCAMFYGLVGLFPYWKQGTATAGREILPIIVLFSAPFTATFLLFWKRLWFKICASSLVAVSMLISVVMTWDRFLGRLGLLYRVGSSILMMDIGSFWPLFGTSFCGSLSSLFSEQTFCRVRFRPYDYLFLMIFVVYTLLITVLASRVRVSLDTASVVAL
jgi:hypothetical protein